MLVVAPHPDDETSGCGGALILHREAGDPVTVACVTDGSGSTALHGSPEERGEQRRRELENATAILGVDSVEWMAHTEGRWNLNDGVATLAELIERIRPALIYAPSRVDFHPEHHKVAQALALAVRETSIDPRIRVYPVLVPLGRPPANLEADTTQLGPTIKRALRAHQSQWGTVERTIRRRRYTAVLGRHTGLWEDFWDLDAGLYSRLHAEPAAREEGFRGLRYDPWTDPLAFLAGRSARRRLAIGA